MDDLVSRQAAIDTLMEKDKKLRNINWYDKPYAEAECRGIDEALSIISNLPSAQPEQQWIPCSERLPSEGENVLLCDTRFGNVTIGRLIRYNNSCCWEVDHWDCDIEDWQAWMPLPEPYKGESS